MKPENDPAKASLPDWECVTDEMVADPLHPDWEAYFQGRRYELLSRQKLFRYGNLRQNSALGGPRGE